MMSVKTFNLIIIPFPIFRWVMVSLKSLISVRSRSESVLRNGIMTILILGCFSSCRLRVDPKGPEFTYDSTLKNASPDFQKGWRDGCESGMMVGGNAFYQMFYKANKQDGFKMATSPDYSDAWDKSWWFCTHSVYIDKKSSVYGSMFSGFQ